MFRKKRRVVEDPPARITPPERIAPPNLVRHTYEVVSRVVSSEVTDDDIRKVLSTRKAAEVMATYLVGQPELRPYPPFTVDYTQSVQRMIKGRGFDRVAPWIKSYDFPSGTGTARVEVVLPSFDGTAQIQDVLARMERLGLRPAAMIELLAFTAQNFRWQHSDYSKLLAIVALGSVMTGTSGHRQVVGLYAGPDSEQGFCRNLFLASAEHRWSDNCGFLAVRTQVPHTDTDSDTVPSGALYELVKAICDKTYWGLHEPYWGNVVTDWHRASGHQEDRYRALNHQSVGVMIADLILARPEHQRYHLVIDYTKSLSEMIRAGGYRCVISDYLITEQYFPVGEGEAEVDAVLLHFDRIVQTKDVVAEMERQGLRPATMVELLALGSQHLPDRRFQYNTIALGSICRAQDGQRAVGKLNYDMLGLAFPGHGWGEYDWFLAVRK